ncbi:MAG TPA: hypothetical protein VF439_00340 [Candidatus Paceibacterota bacterium]
MTVRHSPLEGIATFVASIPLQAREAAGGKSDLRAEIDSDGFMLIRGKSFERIFTRSTRIAPTGILHAARLFSQTDGVIIRDMMRERGLTGISPRQLRTAIGVHATGKTKCLSEESSAANLCFSMSPTGTEYALRVSRTAPGRWLVSIPDADAPYRCGGMWAAGTIVLCLEPDKT